MSFQYLDRPEWALKDVTLSVAEGSFALVCGATGAGKSTLLRAVNGLVPHFTGGIFSGHVAVGGRDTLDHAPRDLADVVAFVPQDPGASFVLDRVEDELAYAMENLAVEQSRMRRRVEETLDLLDIERLRERSVRTLSGGERQRVAIAAALTPGAKILLLDEPTSQLDPQAAEDVLAALHRLVHDHAVTVVLAEHRVERVAGFVDLAIGCFGGGRVEMGDPATMLERMQAGPTVSRLGRLFGWTPLPLTVRQARRMAAERGLAPRRAPAKAEVPAGAPTLLRAERLSVDYEQQRVLRDVSVSLAAGEVVALMGRNGSGKTTLLRCLAGLHAPLHGTVSIAGAAPRPGRDVALLPQTPEDILFKDSVADEVRATLEAHARDDTPQAILGRLGIGDLASRHPRDLSSGERVLTAVAAVVAAGAKVLLLDEPTRGLDARTKERLSNFLRGYAAEGRAVFFATHDVELVAELAERVVMLAGGEVIANGTPREVLSDSPVFAPQTARVFGPQWLTPEEVRDAVES
ncbi:MAG: ATP-binding cassette domain-containing protein [Actinomycetota bacterium]|nr:ATP-binding cassette domain-containing protein [Actinomycetota bacterium]